MQWIALILVACFLSAACGFLGTEPCSPRAKATTGSGSQSGSGGQGGGGPEGGAGDGSGDARGDGSGSAEAGCDFED